MKLKFLTFEMAWFGWGVFYVLLPALTTHKGKEERRGASSLHKKIPATKGPFISSPDQEVSALTGWFRSEDQVSIARSGSESSTSLTGTAGSILKKPSLEG